jgi:hypothetical protein
VSLGERRRSRFPSVLLHPPLLASESNASYVAMSRRSGFAAWADNHSDISPFKRNQQFSHCPISPTGIVNVCEMTGSDHVFIAAVRMMKIPNLRCMKIPL